MEKLAVYSMSQERWSKRVFTLVCTFIGVGVSVSLFSADAYCARARSPSPAAVGASRSRSPSPKSFIRESKLLPKGSPRAEYVGRFGAGAESKAKAQRSSSRGVLRDAKSAYEHVDKKYGYVQSGVGTATSLTIKAGAAVAGTALSGGGLGAAGVATCVGGCLASEAAGAAASNVTAVVARRLRVPARVNDTVAGVAVDHAMEAYTSGGLSVGGVAAGTATSLVVGAVADRVGSSVGTRAADYFYGGPRRRARGDVDDAQGAHRLMRQDHREVKRIRRAYSITPAAVDGTASTAP